MIAHREPRETPVYALVVAKNGPKMAKADENPGVRVVVNGNPLGIAAGTPKNFKGPSGWSMDRLADFLPIGVDRPVINRTGLEGLYKINLSFSRQGANPAIFPRSRTRSYVGVTGAIGAQTGVGQGACRHGSD